MFVVFGPVPPGTVPAPSFVARQIPVAGPWQIEFPSRKLEIPELTSWTTRAEDDLRHFSGKAVYTKEISVPNSAPPGRVWLDLGRVESLATVTLNGKTFPTLWTYPYQVDVTGALRPGTNSLRVDVINSWHNRLAGDAGLSQVQRSTSLTDDPFKPGTPLQPAGLLGPVSLISH